MITDVSLMTPGVESEDLIGTALMFEDTWKYLPDSHRHVGHITNLINGFRDGIHTFYMAQNGQGPVGVLWLSPFIEGIALGNHYMFPGSRWADAITAVKKMTERANSDNPSLHAIMGFIPVFNTLSIRVALRSGYKQVGVIPDSYRVGGKQMSTVIFHRNLEE